MSKLRQEILSCNGCGWQQPFQIWESLNASLDPDAKAQLLEGKLTQFTCEKCGGSADVTYPLLYHDMRRGLMIWLAPHGTPAETEDPQAVRAVADYRLRLVAWRQDLIEKILLAEAGLDDRLFECFKIALHVQYARSAETQVGPVLFAGLACAEGKEPQIRLSLLGQHGSQGACVPLAAYHSLRDAFASKLPPEQAERGHWLRIDLDYAKRVLETP